MDRSEEFLSLICLHGAAPSSTSSPISPFVRLALKISSDLNENDILVERMGKLTGRREFSNDPTEAMENISEIFQRKTSICQVILYLIVFGL